ncbi:MAG: hypothetical protein SVV80_06430 [Planctomycetota bacterium]|nr:hypothetical protein [Planctomycetota bacterium]
MNELKDKSRSRRNFLGLVVRSAALGAIAIVSSVLLKRRFRSSQKCVYRGFCSDCRAFGDCQLPQAMTIKRKPQIARITTNDTNKNG